MPADDAEMFAHASAHAAWWISQRLLAKLIEKGLLTRDEAIAILHQGAEGLAQGGPTNRAAALLLEQAKTYHEKAGGLRSN